MRLRIEGNPKRVWHFMRRYEYPCEWSLDGLSQAILVRLDIEGEAAGFVWAAWHPDLELTLDFHVCVRPEYRGRWLTPEIMSDLEKLAGFLGAHALITETPDDRAAKLVGAMLIRRFGFKRVDEHTVFKRIE